MDQNNPKQSFLSTFPLCFVCPISHDVMKEPVLTSDGHTYEKKEIQTWLQMSTKSPVTGLPLTTNKVIPNYLLKTIIENYNNQFSQGKSEKQKTQNYQDHLCQSHEFQIRQLREIIKKMKQQKDSMDSQVLENFQLNSQVSFGIQNQNSDYQQDNNDSVGQNVYTNRSYERLNQLGSLNQPQILNRRTTNLDLLNRMDGLINIQSNQINSQSQIEYLYFRNIINSRRTSSQIRFQRQGAIQSSQLNALSQAFNYKKQFENVIYKLGIIILALLALLILCFIGFIFNRNENHQKNSIILEFEDDIYQAKQQNQQLKASLKQMKKNKKQRVQIQPQQLQKSLELSPYNKIIKKENQINVKLKIKKTKSKLQLQSNSAFMQVGQTPLKQKSFIIKLSPPQEEKSKYTQKKQLILQNKNVKEMQKLKNCSRYQTISQALLFINAVITAAYLFVSVGTFTGINVSQDQINYFKYIHWVSFVVLVLFLKQGYFMSYGSCKDLMLDYFQESQVLFKQFGINLMLIHVMFCFVHLILKKLQTISKNFKKASNIYQIFFFLATLCFIMLLIGYIIVYIFIGKSQVKVAI